jgi:hypothetical protein
MVGSPPVNPGNACLPIAAFVLIGTTLEYLKMNDEEPFPLWLLPD